MFRGLRRLLSQVLRHLADQLHIPEGNDIGWALARLKEDFSVRRISWPQGYYIYLRKGSISGTERATLMTQMNDRDLVKSWYQLDTPEIDADDWEFYSKDV